MKFSKSSERRTAHKICCGADRDRTDDLRLAKPALSQLSYSPGKTRRSHDQTVVGQGRVELPTSRLSGVRSNHLSYWPRVAGVGHVSFSPRAGCCRKRDAQLRLAPWKLNRTRSIRIEALEEIIRPKATITRWALTLVACVSLTSCKQDWIRRAP